jgi:hypothetical protein
VQARNVRDAAGNPFKRAVTPRENGVEGSSGSGSGEGAAAAPKTPRAPRAEKKAATPTA